MSLRLADKRVLITSAQRYMGPAINQAFSNEGAVINTDNSSPYDQNTVDNVVTNAGPIDILVANLVDPPRTAPVEKIDDADWLQLFDSLVHPLMRLVRAVTPLMKQQGHGKIIAVTSAAPVRGIPNNSAYCAARGAQNAFIKAVGLELAKSNIQVNAIAQNYIANDTYYNQEILDNPKFQSHLEQLVPSKKVAPGAETAELALYLAGENSSHMCGQIIPLAGGWVS